MGLFGRDIGHGILSSLFNWEIAALVMSSINTASKHEERQPQKNWVGELINERSFGCFYKYLVIKSRARKRTESFAITISIHLPRKILTDQGQTVSRINFKVEFLRHLFTRLCDVRWKVFAN